MIDNPFSPLSFIAGPAILTNTCAILQNGATTRYNLAITQWRDFRASLTAGDRRITGQYSDPVKAVALAERRIRLQLRGLGFLNAAVALFAATTVLGLAGAFLLQVKYFPSDAVSIVMVGAGCIGLLFILAATVTFLLESACGKSLLGLHHKASGHERSGSDPHGAGRDDA